MSRPNNAFLATLSDGAFALLSEQLTRVDLVLSSHVQSAQVQADWVYFPVDSLLSMVVLGEPGESVETSMVGLEGVAGLIEACGSGISGVDCIVQVNGAAWRAPASVCRAFMMASPSFAEAAWRSTELQLAEARQSGLCHALHIIDKRLARWLLETSERCGGRNPLPMTQEFLADMLGVQRTSVTTLARRMQSLGIISYSRGRLRILEKDKLEGMACGCRRAMQSLRANFGLSVQSNTAVRSRATA